METDNVFKLLIPIRQIYAFWMPKKGLVQWIVITVLTPAMTADLETLLICKSNRDTHRKRKSFNHEYQGAEIIRSLINLMGVIPKSPYHDR